MNIIRHRHHGQKRRVKKKNVEPEEPSESDFHPGAWTCEVLLPCLLVKPALSLLHGRILHGCDKEDLPALDVKTCGPVLACMRHPPLGEQLLRLDLFQFQGLDSFLPSPPVCWEIETSG